MNQYLTLVEKVEHALEQQLRINASLGELGPIECDDATVYIQYDMLQEELKNKHSRKMLNFLAEKYGVSHE